jgi:hypothetical protein
LVQRLLSKLIGKRQTNPTFKPPNSYEIILLRIEIEEDFSWPEKILERNGKRELLLSGPAARKQQGGVKPIKWIVGNFTHG